MSIELELLSTLYCMYRDGELAAEFDKTSNKMTNSHNLITIMNLVAEVLPEELKPIEAAEKMRSLDEEVRTKAIEESNGKVIDLRKDFQKKVAANGGALGLIKQLTISMDRGDDEAVNEIIDNMKGLVDLSKEDT